MGEAGKATKEVLELDDPESGIIEIPTAIPPPGSIRERQNTLTDDDLTEQARLASVLMDSTPPSPVDPNSAQGIRARLAPLQRVPVVAKSINALGADMKEPRTAFVLGFIDGVLPLETIIEVTGLPELETLQILDRLIAQGAIAFPSRR